MTVGREAFLGPRVDESYLNSLPSLKKLQKLTGLSSVKTEVRRLCDKFLENALREEKEEPEQETNLNALFLGNPGTGKTTVAKLMAEIYRDLNLITKGDMILKTANELMGSVLGESAKLVRFVVFRFDWSIQLKSRQVSSRLGHFVSSQTFSNSPQAKWIPLFKPRPP